MTKKRSKHEVLNGRGELVPDFLRDAVLARWDDPLCMEKYPSVHKCLCPVFDVHTMLRQAGSVKMKIVGPNLIVTITNPSEMLDLDFVVTSLVSAFDEVEAAIIAGNFHAKPSWQKNKKKAPTILDDIV